MEKPIDLKCPNCNTELAIEIPNPHVRSHITPIDSILVYKITSDEIRQFLIQKANFFRKNVKLEMVAQYCENKSRKNYPHNRGHAMFRLAFSNEVVKRKEGSNWVDRIGESDTNVEFVEDIFNGFIQKYQWDIKELDSILKDYKELEKLADQYGITESYIEYIRRYAKPARLPTNNGESWIFFSVRPERIIEDMLENPHTNKVDGYIEIYDVYPITKDSVEFVIYVHDKDHRSNSIDPLVRKHLHGVIKK